MSKVTSIDIDVNVSLNVTYETAQTCLGILNQYFKNHPGCKLSENRTDELRDCDKAYSYDLSIPF